MTESNFTTEKTDNKVTNQLRNSNNNTTSHPHSYHSTYIGDIDIEDFLTNAPNKKRIKKYAEADRFYSDLEARQEIEEKGKRYGTMTLEELREMKIISNTEGRPVSYLTDEKWQKEFQVRKTFVKPYDASVKKFGGKYSRDFARWNQDKEYDAYKGVTNYQTYSTFINDVLRNIRGNQIDYCYYIYQILDLLRFHYDDLRTRYCDGYWEVWLER